MTTRGTVRAHKPAWAGRQWIVGPYLQLVLSEAEFLAALVEIDESQLQGAPGWASKNGARTHHYGNEKGEFSIVGLDTSTRPDGIQIAALLCHEAVHIFQQHCRDIGESAPSSEFEAYAIQYIAQELMYEFARRLGSAAA